MKITIQQAIDLFNAITNMKSGGVYVKGLKNIDLAMNKSIVQPIVDGYNNAMEIPLKYQEYVKELEELRFKSSDKTGNLNDPQKTYEEFNLLKEKYHEAIVEYEDWKNLTKNLKNEEKEVNLIMIDKSDLCFSDDDVCGSAPEIIFGLLPCIKQ